MYLKGSNWSYNHRKRRSSPFRILILVVLVGAFVYVNQVVIPTTSPLFIATPTVTRAPESYVTDAENLAAKGKLSQAIQAYQQAVQADPKNPSIFINLSRLQIYTGQYKDAITNAENALILSPNNSMAQALKGWAEGYIGDYLKAEGSVNEAISIEPTNAAAYAYLAEILALQIQNGQEALGTKDKMVNASRKAVDLAPNSLETHRARGVVLELTANYEEAVREFEAAVGLNPNVADLHLALGRNYRALQQYTKAVEEFSRANGLNPNDSLPLTYISRTYAATGDYAKAIQYAQQAINISPRDPFLYGNLGVMYKSNKQYPDAIENLRLAVKGGKNKDSVDVQGMLLDYGRVAEYYYTYGLVLARQGQCGEAIQISNALSQGVPNDETAVYNAQEMINICQGLSGTPSPGETPLITETTPAETTPTPSNGQ